MNDFPPPLLQVVTDGTEELGYVAIDSLVGGRSCGGLRLLPDIAAAEIRGLARAMTLKYGLLGLPQGGAKAGVRGDPEAPESERRARLVRFGRAIQPWLQSRRFVPAADMGTTAADIRHLLETVGVRVGKRELRGADSGYYTAVTVYRAVRHAVRHRGLDLAECRVAIEGYGKVGGPLAGLLAGAGARIVAVSTSQGALYHPAGLDVARLGALAGTAGRGVVAAYPAADRFERERLPELPVEILCPCARHDSVHAGNVGAVVAPVICPGANNPVTAEARRTLFERGTLYVPDFVCNSGGVLGGTMEFAGVDQPHIVAALERRIGRLIDRILTESDRRGLPPYEIAVGIAEQGFERVRRAAARPTLTRRVFGVGLECYRRGWLPRRLVGRLARPYFERAVTG